jgi:hypothetical protein
MKEADKPPFAGHRAYYIAIKLAVLAVGLYAAFVYLSGR